MDVHKAENDVIMLELRHHYRRVFQMIMIPEINQQTWYCIFLSKWHISLHVKWSKCLQAFMWDANAFVGVMSWVRYGLGNNEMLSDIGGGGLVSVLDVQALFFLLKKTRFAPWPDIMSQTLIYYWQEIFHLTLTSDSEVIL